MKKFDCLKFLTTRYAAVIGIVLFLFLGYRYPLLSTVIATASCHTNAVSKSYKVLQFYSLAVVQSCYFAVFLYCSLTVFLYCSLTILQSCSLTVFLYYSLAVLRSCSFLVLQSCSFAVLLLCSPAVLQSCKILWLCKEFLLAVLDWIIFQSCYKRNVFYD